jgi:hypothetical protein|tara:strand:+ start:712 stop:981 length:270 start_codon:yes stop_codon:yes gene_type:complete
MEHGVNLTKESNMNYEDYGYFDWQREELVKYINKLNADSETLMEENPGLWISKLTNNPDHWAEYGVYDPYTLDAYLDAEAARETRKEYL